MDENAIRTLIESAGHKIFAVTFRKANGEVRNMQCRLHVNRPKHVAAPMGAVDRKAEDMSSGTCTVFDMNKLHKDGKGAYRRFRLDSLMQIRVNGQTFNL